MESRPLRMIWALDPFEQPSACLRTARLLLGWSLKLPISIIPLYVLNPGQLNAQDEPALRWIHRYRSAAERGIAQAVASTGLRTEQPTILVNDFGSQSQAVDAVAHHASLAGANAIVTHTHARAGLKRLLFGSFTESLLARSEVPVVVANPQTELGSDLRTIIFSADFAPASRSVFRNVVALAKAMGTKLILYHCIRQPVEPIFQSGVYLLGGTWIPVHSYYLAERRRVERRARVWTHWAQQHGVKASLHLEKGSCVADSLIDLARTERAGLIALECRKQSWSAAIGGSVAREVIRHAPCPVWVAVPGFSRGAKALPGRAA